jgi:hypothetical protein
MTKLLFVTISALFAFSSFIPAKESPPVKTKKAAAFPPGHAFHVSGSYTLENEVGTTCTGEIIHFSSVTISYNLFGTANKNVYMTHGWQRLTGTAVNPATGEVFVADFETKFSRKIPEQNGVVVVRERTGNCLTGNMGTVDCVNFNLHMTVNAKGEEVVNKPTFEIVCQ